MQEKRIIEKASRLGISIDAELNDIENINNIASSLGIDGNNLNVLENKLDDELAKITYGDTPNNYNSEFSGTNEAREDKVFDKKYYINRQEELDKKVEEAKEEKGKDYKTIDDNGESTTIGKNKFDKVKDDINLLNARKNQIQNRIAGAKAGIYNATHPEEALKNSVEAAKEKVKANIKSKVKEAEKKAEKKAKDALLAFVKKNPYVLAVIGIIVLLIFTVIIIAGGVSINSSNSNNSLYCQTKDEFNMSMNATTLSKAEFVNRALEFFKDNPSYHPNCQKAFNSKEALETIYDVSLENNVNPEVTIARGIAEGCSPGANVGEYTGECQYNTVKENRGVGSFSFNWDYSYNYWGIQTFPGSWNGLTNDWSCYAAIYDSLADGVKAFAEIASKYATITDMMKVYAGQVDDEAAREKAQVMASIRNTIFNMTSEEVDCSGAYSNTYDYGNYVFKVDANGSVNVNNPPKYINQFKTKNFDIKEISNGDISGCSCQSASLSMIILAIGNVDYLINEKGIPLATGSSCPEINRYHATIHYFMASEGLQYGGWKYGTDGNKCGGTQRITAISEEDQKGLGIKIGRVIGVGNADLMLKYLRNGWLIQYNIKSSCPLGKHNCEGLGQTSGGHYGLIYGYDSDKSVFLVHDNGNSNRESATASYDVVNNYLDSFIPVSVYGKADVE